MRTLLMTGPGWTGPSCQDAGSGSAAARLSAMHLVAGATLDLGAVRLLADWPVLLHALLLGVLALEGLAHLRLQVCVLLGHASSLGVRCGLPTLTPPAKRDRKSTRLNS